MVNTHPHAKFGVLLTFGLGVDKRGIYDPRVK